MIGRRLPCLLAGLLWACGSAPDLPTGVGSVDDGPGGSSAGPSTRDGPAVTGGSTALGGSSSTPGGSSGAPQGGVAGLGADGPASIPPPMPVGCVTEVSPGVHHLTCDGLEHDLTIPEACVAQSCGLVVDVHGGTMSGAITATS